MAQHRAIHIRREIAEVATALQDFAAQWEWCDAKPDPKISCCQSTCLKGKSNTKGTIPARGLPQAFAVQTASVP